MNLTVHLPPWINLNRNLSKVKYCLVLSTRRKRTSQSSYFFTHIYNLLIKQPQFKYNFSDYYLKRTNLTAHPPIYVHHTLSKSMYNHSHNIKINQYISYLTLTSRMQISYSIFSFLSINCCSSLTFPLRISVGVPPKCLRQNVMK